MSYYSDARSYLSAGDVRTGIEQMRKALDLAGSALYREDAYARLCLAELDQPEQGAATIAAARAEFPDHPVFAACDLVRRSMAKGDPDQAYRQLLALANTAEMAEIAGKAYFNIGKSFSAAGNHERAALAFGRSLHILPDRRNALEHLSIALTTSGQNQRAREVLQYLNRLFPERLSKRRRPSGADATR